MAHTAPLPYRASTVWVVVADDAHARVYSREPRNVIVSRNARQADEILTWTLRDLPDVTVIGSDGNNLPLEIADRLNRAHGVGRFDGVIVIAPPPWLGDFRPHLTREARDAVIGELAKDLTKLPRARLLQKIADLLPAREGAPL